MIQAERPVRVAVVYYSATGNVHALARAVSEGAARKGAEVRLRHVAELNQEMLISVKQYWGRHRSEIEDQPEARLEDIDWADGFAFGTPTRFGNVAAQLKLFLDLTGELWQQGRLIDKVATGSRPRRPSTAGRNRRFSPSTTRCTPGGRSCSRSGTRCTKSSTGAETRTAHPSRVTTAPRGPLRRRSWSRGRRELVSLVSRG